MSSAAHAQLPLPRIPLPRVSVVTGLTPTWVGSAWDDYVRTLQLAGEVEANSRLLRPLVDEGRALHYTGKTVWGDHFRPDTLSSSRGIRVSLYDPIEQTYYNSAYPSGMNDGAMWQGRGLSEQIQFGSDIRWGPLTVRLAPSLFREANDSFAIRKKVDTTSKLGPYSDPYTPKRIDRPQRFGNLPISRLDPGQSSVRLDLKGLALGYGFENMWWGPGVENSLLMTNNAGGFKHWFIGTGHPIGIHIGKLEAQWVMGRLADSDEWRVRKNILFNRRFFNSVTFAFTPGFAPGLSVGAARVFYMEIPDTGLKSADYTDIFQPFFKKSLVTKDNPGGSDLRDQMFSVFARWVLPSVHFETYFELGRNDHAADMRDFILNPDHSRAYVVGFQKLFMNRDGFVKFGGEAFDLERPTSQLTRWTPIWYTHKYVPQGYTQRGQVIGAGTGPGSSGVFLNVDTYRHWGGWGLFANRVRVNDDEYLNIFGNGVAKGFFLGHDVTLTGGARGSYFLGPLDIAASIALQKDFNRYFFNKFINGTPNDVRNVNASLTVEYRW